MEIYNFKTKYYKQLIKTFRIIIYFKIKNINYSQNSLLLVYNERKKNHKEVEIKRSTSPQAWVKKARMKQAEQTDNLKKNEVYNVRKSIILVHIFRNFFLHFRTLQRNQTSNVPLSNTWFSDVLNKTYKSIFFFR